MPADLDPHGQLLELRFNRARRAERDLSEMLGLVKGMLCDGVISDAEAAALHHWVAQHPDAAEHWMVRAVQDRLHRVLADGVIEDDERSDLHDLLSSLIGGTITTVLSYDGATTLPVDDPLPVILWDCQVFVFTGRFAYGTRRDCEREVLRRGGVCESGVTKRTNYLIIGTFGSLDWVHTAFGRKIEKAVALRSDGSAIHIVPEDHWASTL